MVVRQKRKGRKYHGTRSWGAGNTKNRRGKGCRGGKGNAGVKGHRRTYFVKYDPHHIGRYGFIPPSVKKTIHTINLGDIQRMIDKGDVKKSGEKYEYVFNGKVLGSGSIVNPVIVKANSFSKKAKEKLVKVSGEAKTE
ncbi:MAG: uL15 family ribosomal protein [Candidatus Micrarchaeota archaeon]